MRTVFFILLTSSVVALAATPPLPPARKVRIMSPREATVQAAATMSEAVVQPRRVVISWDYQDLSGRVLTLPRPGVAFDIETSADLKIWTPLATVSAPPYVDFTTAPSKFYRYKNRRVE